MIALTVKDFEEAIAFYTQQLHVSLVVNTEVSEVKTTGSGSAIRKLRM